MRHASEQTKSSLRLQTSHVKACVSEHDGRRPGSSSSMSFTGCVGPDPTFGNASSRSLEPGSGARERDEDVRGGSAIDEGSSSWQSEEGQLPKYRRERRRQGPLKLVTVNSPTNVSREFRQRELHWIPSAPHRPVMHGSFRSRDERKAECT